MKHREELFSGMAIAGAALGADFVSGRGTAVFYAQMAQASWWGIGLSSALFGLLVGLLAHLCRRMGAGSMPALLGRIDCGRGVGALFGATAIAGTCMLADSAGHMGALVLPVQNGALFGALGALLLAAALAFSGGEAFRRAGAAFFMGFLLFESALLLWGKIPGEAHAAVDLRLENCVPAAFSLGILHAAAAMCISAGACVRLSFGRVSPLQLGVFSGTGFAAVLGVGNAVLMSREASLLALEAPFAALSSGWGRAGFYLCAAMIFAASVLGMGGIFAGLLRPARRGEGLEK